MDVGDYTQLDQNGLGGDRCGETCLHAALTTLGYPGSVYDICSYLGVPYNEAKSTIPDLVQAAHHYGAGASVLYDYDSCIAALKDSIVIIELYNGYLQPSPYPMGSAWHSNHYVVLTNVNEYSVTIMDPLTYPYNTSSKNHRIVSLSSFLQSVHAVQLSAWGFKVFKPVSTKPVVPVGPKKVCN